MKYKKNILDKGITNNIYEYTDDIRFILLQLTYRAFSENIKRHLLRERHITKTNKKYYNWLFTKTIEMKYYEKYAKFDLEIRRFNFEYYVGASGYIYFGFNLTAKYNINKTVRLKYSPTTLSVLAGTAKDCCI